MLVRWSGISRNVSQSVPVLHTLNGWGLATDRLPKTALRLIYDDSSHTSTALTV